MAHIDVAAGETAIKTAETTETRAKYTVAKAVISASLQPLTFSKTLYQLGFEPTKWPAKVNLVPRHKASRLPTNINFFKSVHSQFGLCTMYRGAAAGFAGAITGGFVTNYVEQYLDTFFVDVGGKLGDLAGKQDEDLILMVREIMKVVRHDHACPNALSALLRVGEEEGLPGLFAGLVPSMLANLVCVWTLFGVSFAINRTLIYIEKGTEDQDNRKALKNVRAYTPYLLPFVANSFAYAFEVDAVVASVAGYSR